MKVQFLGTSSCTPLPREDKCPQCRSRDPRDKRLRTATLISDKILIDAGPDILKELKKVKIEPKNITHLLLTHRHFDAAGGLGKLKKMNPKITVFVPQEKTYHLAGLEIKSFYVPHCGARKTVGYLIDNKLAYISDTKDITRSYKYLKKADFAILDGSGWKKVFPSHQSMKEIIDKVKLFRNLRKIYFTHIGHSHLNHPELEKTIQKAADKRFRLAYDGLKVIFS